jgi:FMN reductase
MALKILGISGSVSHPSRTATLVRAIVDGFAEDDRLETDVVELADAAPHLFAALTRNALHGRAAEIVHEVEQADLLVIGTPVYRASYTGALKHLFDLVHHQYFTGKPVILAATGGTKLHGLVTEHQLRPLFGFLNALTLPTAIYAVEQDFADYRLANEKISARIARAVEEGKAQLAHLHGNDAPRLAAE